ncbi:MAG: ribonuclease HI family protein [Candidatus Woesebacteria bacterium]|nr:ribonuclease HI family protein [Candidatus Woesebacteria bacterium]
MIIYCDGGSRGNPGPAASAFVVTEGPSKDEAGKVIYKDSKFLGVETNNVAEYTAVLIAIKWLSSQFTDHRSPNTVVINLDSQLVERQLNGFYKVKNIKLKLLADEIKLKIVNCKLKINFVWDYRTKNTLADDLVNEELDLNGKTEINF